MRNDHMKDSKTIIKRNPHGIVAVKFDDMYRKFSDGNSMTEAGEMLGKCIY